MTTFEANSIYYEKATQDVQQGSIHLNYLQVNIYR